VKQERDKQIETSTERKKEISEKKINNVFFYCPNFFLIIEKRWFPLSSMSILGSPFQFLSQVLLLLPGTCSGSLPLLKVNILSSVTISYLSGFNFGCLSSVSSQGR
jgi:hypothetical protein